MEDGGKKYRPGNRNTKRLSKMSQSTWKIIIKFRTRPLDHLTPDQFLIQPQLQAICLVVQEKLHCCWAYASFPAS